MALAGLQGLDHAIDGLGRGLRRRGGASGRRAAAGGGGIPVVADERGELTGIAAVIDKDHACSLLANEIEAELFLVTTAVEKVALDFGRPTQRWIDRMTLSEAKEYLAEGTHFLPGSMAPKIEAVVAGRRGAASEESLPAHAFEQFELGALQQFVQRR